MSNESSDINEATEMEDVQREIDAETKAIEDANVKLQKKRDKIQQLKAKVEAMLTESDTKDLELLAPIRNLVDGEVPLKSHCQYAKASGLYEMTRANYS
jgi:hypothetical protein